jgi:hypothetical protein
MITSAVRMYIKKKASDKHAKMNEFKGAEKVKNI